MKRVLSLFAAVALSSMTAGCGDTVTGLLDGFLPGAGDMTTPPDMAITLYRLPEGVWKVSGPVTMLDDKCNVNPNDPMNPTAGQIYGLVNDGAGNIKLGNTDKFAMPDMPQMYDAAESGMPPQPAQGASCPGTNNPAQCATEPTAKPFNDNKGTLVRDNKVTANNCTFNRHVVNQLTLTADGKFTSEYTRTDTMKSMCITNKEDCTTKWTWQFEFVKQFGK